MNFKTIIQELVDFGLTQIQIAEYCKCRQSTISDLFTGKTKKTNFEIGHALIQLRDERLRKSA